MATVGSQLYDWTINWMVLCGIFLFIGMAVAFVMGEFWLGTETGDTIAMVWAYLVVGVMIVNHQRVMRKYR